MNCKKNFPSLILFSFIPCIILLSSCSRTNNTHVTLTVLNYLDSADPNSANDVSAIWDNFEKQNPDITIIREDSFGNEFHDKTAKYLSNNNLPDIINMWPGGRSSAVHTSHAVKDLRPFITDNKLDSKYNPVALQNQFAGYLAELPDGITYTNVLFVNAKLLQQNGLSIPQKYEDFFTIQEVLSKKGIQTILMDNKQSWVMQSLLFSLVAGRYGGIGWTQKIQSGEYSFTDDWFVTSLRIIDELCRKNVISQKTLAYEYGESQNYFADGQGAFYIGGDWKTATFQTDHATGQGLISKDAQQFDFELMSMPPFPNEILHNSDSGTVGTGWAINSSIPAGSPKEKAAWRLIQYLESPYVQTYRLKTGKAFPTIKSLDVELLANELGLEPFTIKRARLYKDYPTMTPVIDNAFSEDIYTVINTQLYLLISGKTSPEIAAKKIEDAWKNHS